MSRSSHFPHELAFKRGVVNIGSLLRRLSTSKTALLNGRDPRKWERLDGRVLMSEVNVWGLADGDRTILLGKEHVQGSGQCEGL